MAASTFHETLLRDGLAEAAALLAGLLGSETDCLGNPSGRRPSGGMEGSEPIAMPDGPRGTERKVVDSSSMMLILACCACRSEDIFIDCKFC